MNTATYIAIAAVLGAAGAAMAQPGEQVQKRERRQIPPEIVEQFDTDLDGQLSKEEIRAMREEVKLRREQLELELTQKFDADGDGVLSRNERRTAFDARRAELLEKYDEDGDGELSPDEHFNAVRDDGFPPMRMMGPDGRRGKRGERGQRQRGPRGEGMGRFGDEMALGGPPSEGCEQGECPKGQQGARGQRGARGERGQRGQGREGGRFFRMNPEDMQQFDTDGDGQLSPEERQAARAQLRQRLQDRMVEFDADGDGVFTREEKAAARRAFAERHETRRLQKRAGDAIDADNDGNISPEELTAALEKIRLGDTALDLNRDGAVDEQDTALLVEKVLAPKPE